MIDIQLYIFPKIIKNHYRPPPFPNLKSINLHHKFS